MQNRELRECQQRLETSHARYAELYEQAPVGYVSLDPKDRFIGIVSHELRTPLNTILGWTQVAQSHIGETPMMVRAVLSNAVKFTRSGGHVLVILTRSARAVRLTITDDGCGIDADDTVTTSSASFESGGGPWAPCRPSL